jgi:hypothetical protein
MVKQVIRQRFFTLDDVLAAIRNRGLRLTTYVVDHVAEAGLHWLVEDVYGYILRGSAYALDAGGNWIDVRRITGARIAGANPVRSPDSPAG